MTDTRVAYVAFKGGLDLATPPIQLPPGALSSCLNFEAPIDGGYRTVDGYVQVGSALPGEGPVLGVSTFGESILAIRANTGGTDASLFQWDPVAESWDVVGAALPVGRYSFDAGNFLAVASGRALFMVCPGGKPWMYDGTTLTELSGAAAGASWVKVHAHHLFLGWEVGSLQWSGVGDPTKWATLDGAGELGVGDELTGLAATAEGVLMVFCRNSISALYGTSSADFTLKSFASGAGARPHTVVSMSAPFFVGERGMSSLYTVSAAGDFDFGNWGRQVEPLFKAGFVPAAALVSKRKNQYRVLDATGQGIYATVVGQQTVGSTLVRWAHTVACAHSGELDSGAEVLLFGDTEGAVFQLDEGNSFAGQDIVSAMTTAFNHFGAPSTLKRFRRMFIDVRGVVGAEVDVRLLPMLDGGDGLVARNRADLAAVPATGGLWELDRWDEFAWSGGLTPDMPVSLTGSGRNFGFLVSHVRNGGEPFVLNGYTMHYTPRRLRRG